jgi:hypothetical protein
MRARAGTPGEEPFGPFAVAAASVATSTADPGAASLGMVTAPLKFPLLSGVSVASTGPVKALK